MRELCEGKRDIKSHVVLRIHWENVKLITHIAKNPQLIDANFGNTSNLTAFKHYGTNCIHFLM